MKVMKRHFHGGWYEQFCFGIAMGGCGGSVFPDLYRADGSHILSSGHRLGVVHGSTDGHGNVLVSRSPTPAVLRDVLWRQRIISVFGKQAGHYRIPKFLLGALEPAA